MKVGKCRIHGRAVLLDNLNAALGVRLPDRFADLLDRLSVRQDIRDGKEARLHHGVDA
jgi:hypothetical protein